MRKTALHLATPLFVAMLAGCGSSTDVTSNTTTPTIPTNTFSGPSTTSSDTYAQLATSYALSANVFSSAFFGAVQAANANHSGNTWTWSGTSQGVTVTFTATQQSDGSYTWQWVVNGTSTAPGILTTYNNWTALTGTSSSDGKTGEWKIYNTNATTLAADWVWVPASGSVSGTTGTLTTYSTSGGAVTAKLIVTNRTDKTGEVDVYSVATLVFKATWTATGSGQWTTYDSSTGVQNGSGSWQ